MAGTVDKRCHYRSKQFYFLRSQPLLGICGKYNNVSAQLDFERIMLLYLIEYKSNNSKDNGRKTLL